MGDEAILANIKVHIQGIEVLLYWLTKRINKNHNINGYMNVHFTQPSLHK